VPRESVVHLVPAHGVLVDDLVGVRLDPVVEIGGMDLGTAAARCFVAIYKKGRLQGSHWNVLNLLDFRFFAFQKGSWETRPLPTIAWRTYAPLPDLRDPPLAPPFQKQTQRARQPHGSRSTPSTFILIFERPLHRRPLR
jgi:hypothetical protein